MSRSTIAWARRLRLFRLLLQRREISTAQAATFLKKDKETARRDLKALEECGVALTKLDEDMGRAERWGVTEALQSVGIAIGLDERLALLFGRELVLGALQETDVGDKMDELAHHISALEHSQLPEKDFARRFYCRHEPKKSYAGFREELRAIVSCLIDSKRLTFEYTKPGKPTELLRGARPLTLLMYKRGLYVVAYKPGPGDHERSYAVERMSKVRSDDTTFDYPTPGEYHPKRLFERQFGIWKGRHPASEVVLHFESHARPYAEDRQWMEGQSVTLLSDGRHELKFVATGQELVSFVASFGPAVEVIEPAWLREQVIDSLDRALARYRKTSVQ